MFRGICWRFYKVLFVESLTLSWRGKVKVKVKVNSVSIESENESGVFSIYTFTPEPDKGLIINRTKFPRNLIGAKVLVPKNCNTNSSSQHLP